MSNRPVTDRSHDRYRVAACADVAGSDLLLYHRIDDLSEGGMRFAAAAQEPLGTTVDVVLTFPRTAEEVAVRGEVVWVSDELQERQVGLRWVDLSRDERIHLRKQIAASMTSLVSPSAA